MSTSQAHSGSKEDDGRKEAMGKEVAVEDFDNQSTYNSLTSSESSGSEIDATASKEVRKLARKMAKKMAKKKTDKIMKKMETMEKTMATMMKKMEKEETPSTSPKKSTPPSNKSTLETHLIILECKAVFLLTSSRCPSAKLLSLMG